MAITGTDRGTLVSSAAATSVTFSPASNFAAGSLAVCCLALNNTEANGVAYATFTVTDNAGNTWTRRISPLYDPGAASAGVEGAIFTTPMDGGTLTTSTVITVTVSTTQSRWTGTLMEVVPTAGYAIGYVDGDVSAGSNTASPTITTASITSGNMVIAALFAEWNDTITEDGDTTNGTWSTQQTAGSGAVSATGISVASQRKVVTSTATQTYNPTLTACDNILGWIQLTESIVGISVTPGTLALVLSTFAPTVVATDNKSATPTTVALVLSTFAPTVAVGSSSAPGWLSINGWWLGGITTGSTGAGGSVSVTPSTASLILTGLAPTVAATANVAVTPGTLALVLTTFEPTVALSDNQAVTPTTLALTLSTFAPTVAATANQAVTPSTVALVLTTFEPIITVGDAQAIIPGVASLTLTTFAPTVATTANQAVTPSTASLVVTGFAPTVVASDAQAVTPSTLALVLTTFAPTVAVTAGSVITPGTVALTLTTFAPTVTATANQAVTPGAATLILSTFAPVITGISPAYETVRHILYGTSLERHTLCGTSLQRHTLHATSNERHTLSGSTP